MDPPKPPKTPAEAAAAMEKAAADQVIYINKAKPEVSAALLETVNVDWSSRKTVKRSALLTFGFTGTDYFGLAGHTPPDPKCPTIADAIRRALLEEGLIVPSNFEPTSRTKWQLASRTDKGVHAACAAASMRVELTVEEMEAMEAVAVPAADGVEPNAKRQKGQVKGHEDQLDAWQMSASALDRVNLRLPPSIKIFSATRVGRRFCARTDASSRTYEYLLPVSALGHAPQDGLSDLEVAEARAGVINKFDEALKTFEGSFKFHNFASGLRDADDAAKVLTTKEGDEWPLALDPQFKNATSFRSVITCRVHREITVSDTAYLVVRVSGAAFVLHQIRHMVGAALAVSHGVAPVDALVAGLKSPLRVDVAPLAPGMGLLLDGISWFESRTGEDLGIVTPAARRSMDEWKDAVVYPHIHGLYADGVFTDFLSKLKRGGLLPPEYGEAGIFSKLRRVFADWENTIRERVREKRANRAMTVPQPDAWPAKLLPSGLLIALCNKWQTVPCRQTHEAMNFLRNLVERGQLRDGVDHDEDDGFLTYDFYLAKLSETMPL